MPRIKDVTLTLRTTAEIKSLLRQAAELEHRSITSMVEVLVLIPICIQRSTNDS